jgi:hypothetical protein
MSFALDHLRDHCDLQLFIAVMNAPDRWWDARAAARELQVPDDVARAALEHLAGRNLLEIRLTGEVRYQFRPGSDELHLRSLAFAEAFAGDPLEVVRALTPSVSLRSR